MYLELGFSPRSTFLPLIPAALRWILAWLSHFLIATEQIRITPRRSPRAEFFVKSSVADVDSRTLSDCSGPKLPCPASRAVRIEP